MKLYYTPGACSLASHITLREAGAAFELEKVDLGTHKTAAGEDYNRVNPKGYVPALVLDDGQTLTEGVAIMQYVADQKPDAGLAARAGSMERYRLVEWLNFIGTEVHKTFGPLWNPKTPEETKQTQRNLLSRRFDHLAAQLQGRPYLMGNTFTIADAYLFTVLNWTGMHDIDLAKWPALKQYMAHIGSRPHVVEALKAEGLAK
jgi:glutathione S-transferase